MKFIYFHGSFGSPTENWFPVLKQNLEGMGQNVIAPQFPVEDWDELTAKGPDYVVTSQTLENWMRVFEAEVLPQIKAGEQLCFIGHSIAPVFILHIIAKHKLQLNSAIFVCPFLTDIGANIWQFDSVNGGFYQHSFDYAELQRLIPVSYSVFSDNDPYVAQSFSREFAAKLNSSPIIVKGGGHLGKSAGVTNFPLVLELCKTRLDFNLKSA